MVIRSSAEVPSPDDLSFQTPAQADAVARAASVLGKSEKMSLALIRELQSWRRRALDAEGGAAFTQAAQDRSFTQSSDGALSRFSVVGSLDSERVLLISCGKNFGVFEGAVISIGAGVKAKVVESRSNLCAAVIENAFQGKVSVLDGQPAQLVLVR